MVSFTEIVDRRRLSRGLDAMRRRGPDAVGEWWSDDGYTALGHRRLAILDLDSRANQPMRSADGRYVIAFNGEIYNFLELRSELEAKGVVFVTTSDTEVLLALFARERANMLSRLRGMFAFAIWDNVERRLFVARDPYGIKPLYIAMTSHGVLIASQVKALLATGLVSRDPDANGQAGFWMLGSVPEPHTWYRHMRALPAGHYTTITAEGVAIPKQWRDIGDIWREGSAPKQPLPEIRECVRNALRASVGAHLVSDVPVGIFLSGGIDSGSLAALMLEAGAGSLQGVTLAFREFSGCDNDEGPAASRLARQYGIRHHVFTVRREEFESDLPRIIEAMDQPSIDGINTWYASKAVAELGLKVVVSGVGGDELFQGYPSFNQLPTLVSRWRGLSRIPGARPLARAVFGCQAWRTKNPRWKLLPEPAASIEGAWFLRRGLFSDDELPGLMGEDLADESVKTDDPGAMVRDMTGPLAADPRLALGQIESMTYLRNQLLRDSDWASMDHSVELRTPLVDAWLLRQIKPVLRGLQRFPQKRLLAEAPALSLPEDMIRRPKIGFEIPTAVWMGLDPNSRNHLRSRFIARRVAAECYGSE